MFVNPIKDFVLRFVLVRSTGEIMTLSLAQGGTNFSNFLWEWGFRYICCDDYGSIPLSASDVTDLEVTSCSKGKWHFNKVCDCINNDKVTTNFTWHLICFLINSATKSVSRLMLLSPTDTLDLCTQKKRQLGEVGLMTYLFFIKAANRFTAKYILLMKHFVH